MEIFEDKLEINADLSFNNKYLQKIYKYKKSAFKVKKNASAAKLFDYSRVSFVFHKKLRTYSASEKALAFS